MTATQLADHLMRYLESPRAKSLCRKYNAVPADATSELLIKLSKRRERCVQAIRNPTTGWMSRNATGLLRNFLRAECSALKVFEDGTDVPRSGRMPRDARHVKRVARGLFSLNALNLNTPSDLEMTAEQDEVRNAVNRELQRLPRRQREAILGWAHVDGDSCRAVADRHGVSVQTVCNWASKAMTALRPRLEGFL
jgi:RNA polymerase sigma factor (sigma-70 family)